MLLKTNEITLTTFDMPFCPKIFLCTGCHAIYSFCTFSNSQIVKFLKCHGSCRCIIFVIELLPFCVLTLSNACYRYRRRNNNSFVCTSLCAQQTMQQWLLHGYWRVNRVVPYSPWLTVRRRQHFPAVWRRLDMACLFNSCQSSIASCHATNTAVGRM